MICKQRLFFTNILKHTGTSFYINETVSKFIIQNILKVIGITLKILGKELMLIKNITAPVPHSIGFNNKTITDPETMSNVFNNCFTPTTKTTNSNIKFSPKHYTDYLSSWHHWGS